MPFKQHRGYWLWVLVTGVTGALLLLLNLTNTAVGLREVLTYAFMLIFPGMVWVRLIELNNPIFRLPIAIALSLTFVTITAEGLLYSGHWSVLAGLVILEGITLLGLILEGVMRTMITRQHG